MPGHRGIFLLGRVRVRLWGLLNSGIGQDQGMELVNFNRETSLKVILDQTFTNIHNLCVQ